MIAVTHKLWAFSASEQACENEELKADQRCAYIVLFQHSLHPSLRASLPSLPTEIVLILEPVMLFQSRCLFSSGEFFVIKKNFISSTETHTVTVEKV